MKIKEVITIDERFQHSINLKLDQMRREPIENFIPTHSALQILSRYLELLSGEKRDSSTLLIGPYGKGKSHLLLVLMYLLNPFDEHLTEKLLKNIQKADETFGLQMKEYLAQKKHFLPIVVSFGSDSLEHSYRSGLVRALKRFGLEDCIPNSYYKEALQTIKQWKKEYPETYDKLKKALGKVGIHSFCKALEQEEEEAMEQFRRLYPALTAGSQFAPMIQTDITTLYEEINARICREPYGYQGMVVIFDEFSKFMESETKEKVSKDMNLVQQMCELANQSSGDSRMLQIFVAHKSVKEYSGYLSKEVINTFTGVEGRLSEYYFVTTQKDNYELIKNMVQPLISLDDMGISWSKIAEKNYGTAGFDKDFTREEFEEIVVKGCYPMRPLATFLLLKVSERIGQNERSLVTFLASRQEGSLVDYIQREKEIGEMVCPDLIFDYFSPLLKRDLWNRRSHLEWSKAMMALEKGLTREETCLVKTICLMRIVGLSEKMEATAQTLSLACGMTMEETQKRLTALEKKEVVLYRDKLNSYVIRQKIDVDLEEKLAACEKEITHFSMPQELEKIMGHRYELPKKYNHIHGMTRFFDYLFMETDVFLQMKSTEILYEESMGGAFADGKILLLLDSDGGREDQIQKHISELNDDKLIAIYPEKPFDAEGLLKRRKGIEMILKEEEFLNHDEVLLEELWMMEEDCRYKLNWLFEENFVPGHSSCQIYAKKMMASVSFNQLISDICEQCYGWVPRINHELINRRKVSSQIKKARMEIVRHLIAGDYMEQWENGNSAEATIYRATMVHTGIRRNRPTDQMDQVLQVIYSFVLGADGKRESFETLYENLRGAKLGLRDGVIPIYLAHCVRKFNGNVVIYEGDREHPFQAEILEAVNDAPEKYAMYLEKGSRKKEVYLEKLQKIFPFPPSYEIQFQNLSLLEKIVESMQFWFTHLPASSRMATYADKANEKLSILLAQKADNPRQFLFDELPAWGGERKRNINYDDLCKKIVKAKEEMDSYHENLLWQIRDIVSKYLDIQDETLRPALKEWANNQKRKRQTSLLTAAASEILSYFSQLEQETDREVLYGLAKIVTGRYPEDFRQDTIQGFEIAIQEFCRELNESEMASKGTCHFSYTDKQGNHMEKFFDEVETDSVMEFAQAAVEEAISEFGDSLEKNQKVKILLDLLQQELE
ncbi:MAG: hypothetical protein PUG66_07320 [Clostridiales bacterium]|nr:hypothetical protein [Clostridiales bacterium]